MSAPISTAQNYTDLQGLSQLKAQAKEGQPSEELVREAAAQFESLFIKMMLQSMREASLAEDEIFNSPAMEQYRDLMDHQLSMDMAKKGGIGLADQLVAQMGGKPVIPQSAKDQGPLSFQRVGFEGRVNQVQPVQPDQPEWQPDTPEAFIRELMPRASRVAEKLGVSPDAIVAQAALETGWGKHQIKHSDGGSSFNLFGIKAGSNWEGRTVSVPTLEYRDGVAQKEVARFRAYDSLEEGLADYAAFIQNNGRYQNALGLKDPASYARALQEAGYATDPAYAKKIESILGRQEFAAIEKELKLSEGLPITGSEEEMMHTQNPTSSTSREEA
ncbi:MAG: flagellar assembly peptidoglycan hydrolase FlgJ [Gammaproteobacteria bacterium]|nr:flagellar assembly peptidoglycan hydrolase FlgJ [Gammaproteobacteria bacterium]